MLVHLSVAYCHHSIRHQFGNLICNLLYASDSVKYNINLTAPAQFTLNYFLKELVILLQNICLHRISFLRRLLDKAHVLDARQRHVKSTRNRCSRKSQHVNVGL